MKKKIPLFKIIFTFFLFFITEKGFSQEKKLDSISIRQDYTLPNPTHYEPFYDIKSGNYFLYPKIGNIVTGPPLVLTTKEYYDFVLHNNMRDYYEQKAGGTTGYKESQKEAEKKGLIPSIKIKNKIFETIFGSNKIELIPNGFASFDLGGLYQKIDNPLILPQNRSNFAINIQQRIQLGMLGKVGENLQLKANYDTQSGFAFENKLNLVWQAKGTWKDLQSKTLGDLKKEGGEDKIIKRVEFGNVNMPLSTNLIRGSESLFGLKTEFQLGKTYGTLVFSQQQGEARNIVVQGGGVMQTYKIFATDYEDNQHYFLGHYFSDTYDNALLNYPLINSKINISKLEVWALDQGSGNFSTQKSIIGIRDLGEGGTTPDNTGNSVYSAISTIPNIRTDSYNVLNGNSLPTVTGNQNYVSGEHFIFNSRAKKLNASEYTFNPQLGYISLNQRLNDQQLLAVSYSYTISGDNKVYKVGEFSDESSVIITKLLKPNSTVRTTSPMWDLMMKNIYSLNSGQIDAQNFMLNVLYKDNESGKVNYLPGTTVKDINLLKLLNWDRLNVNNDIQQNSGGTSGDGLFDFVPGITVDAQNSRLIFTKTQPFGKFLETTLGSNDPKFVFKELYTEQKEIAKQNNLAQRYTLEGRYKGGQGSGISLGAINVPRGSVKVTANGVLLTEGVDYTVDYMLGQVTIINEMVKQSGQAINVSLENQLTFNTQRKRFLGLNLERKFNENLTIGATVINYSERPLTQKVQLGQEAVNNTMVGFNMLYNNQSQFLTRLTDKIPLVNTEAPSNINFRVEGAYLIPGQNKGTGDQSYIDDFEQSTSKISLKEPSLWSLASKPEKNANPIYGNSNNNDTTNGYGRGLLSWYNIDPRFFGVGGKAPNGITTESLSNHASRRVQMSELFNNRDYVAGEQTMANTFDITYYPLERGPYNLNPNAETASQRWAGLMRPISISNFTNSNIEYVEFWMMDPYADGKMVGTSPKLSLQLGNVSEDVLKDGKLQYENGLPTPTIPNKTSTTNWGNQPQQFPILYAYSTENEERTAQDVGYDGLGDTEEQTKFTSTFVNPVTQQSDPAADDFVFYLSDQFQGTLASSLPQRYKYFRNPDGNSKSNSLEVATQSPDAEDANRDYNLDQNESYNQYDISLAKTDLVLGQNNIVDVKEVNVKFQNGQSSTNKWYLFRIPVINYTTSTETNSQDAQSILNNVRFARLMLTGFEETSTIRLGTFDLVRSDWRKYGKNVAVVDTDVEGTTNLTTSELTNLEVGSVNLEENALGKPPYVLPPGIDRQVISGNAGTQRQNEASLYLKANNLGKEARGVYKNVALDMRRFQNLELFVHAEDLIGKGSNLDGKTKFFIRFGSDATDNYYEYETSLKYTSPNAVSPLDIWPNENTIRLDIQEFVNAKLRKDKLGISLSDRYKDIEFGDGNKSIYTKGRPSLGNVSTIMIGIRNTETTQKDVILWVNEIRLSGTENKGGYAGNASVNFNLGDFAMVNANGAYSTIGFGYINQKPTERAQTTNSAYGINTTVNVDKFLPEKVGLKVPVNYSYTQTTEDPKYNPLNDDVEFNNDPKKDELKKIARTYTRQRSIGVLNMRKERTNPNKKPKFYDVENISVTALYNDDFFRDIYTKNNYRQYLRANIDYNFNFKPWLIKPFNKSISDTAKSYQYLRWAKEINFNIVPTRVSFRTEIDRNYNELQFRNLDAILNGNLGNEFDVIRNRNFFFGWQYNLGFNFTKSLKADISSATRTLNDNLDVNLMDTNSIFKSPFRAGRPVLYNHKIQLNYKFPFEYLPYLDFINAEIGYGMQYNWNARSTALLNSNGGNLGNLAQNTNNINATASADIPSFLNKFSYFKKINDKMQKRRSEIDSLNNVYNQNFTKKKKTGFRAYHFKNKLTPLQAFSYALTSVKQIDFTFTENNGTVLPGILSSPNFYGYGQGIGGPTLGFLFGSQADIRLKAIESSWISKSELMNDPYSQMKNQNITGNIQIQPINDFRIDLNFLRNYTKNIMQGGYNVDVNPLSPVHDFSFASELITISNTNILLRTSFMDSGDLYQKVRENARQISASYGGVINPDGFSDGHSIANAYVLIPAFQAAIEGKSPTQKDPVKAQFPLPNWRITYGGLRNVPFINSQFSKFDILHAYTSTYTSSGIQRNIDYYNNSNALDVRKDFVNPYTFAQLVYDENFSPLIGADVTMRNNMQFKAMYNRNRTYALGLTNHTLTEDTGSEYVLGFGYIMKDLKLKLRFRGKEKKLKSDLNMRADFSLRDNRTKITNILLDDAQITGGQKLFSLKVSADYNISQNFNIRFFYDQMMTKYKISTAFPLSTIRAGLTATFNFGGGSGF